MVLPSVIVMLKSSADAVRAVRIITDATGQLTSLFIWTPSSRDTPSASKGTFKGRLQGLALYPAEIAGSLGRARSRFRGGHHGSDLELHQVVPARRPLLEEAFVLGLHELKASVQPTRVDPAVDIFEPRRKHPTRFRESCINRRRPLPVSLNDHVAHAFASTAASLGTTPRKVPEMHRSAGFGS